MRLIDADALHKAYMELRNFKQDPQSGDWISLRAVPLTTVIRLLNEAPTIDAVEVVRGEWIPCSERMPENGNYYLWCSDMGIVQSDYYWNGFDKERKYGYNIVAWMPLPKPYGERKDERSRR